MFRIFLGHGGFCRFSFCLAFSLVFLAMACPVRAESLDELVQALEQGKAEERLEALKGVMQVISQGSDQERDQALTLLVDTMGNDNVQIREMSMLLLAQLGETALPYLVQGLGDEDKMKGVNCAVALSRMGPGASGAMPALEEALDDEPAGLSTNEAAMYRITMAYAIQCINPADPAADKAEEVFRETLVHEEPQLRQRAVAMLEALSGIAPMVVGFIPDLTTVVMNDSEAGNRAAAVYALGEILPDGIDEVQAEAQQALLQALTDKDESVRAAIVAVFGVLATEMELDQAVFPAVVAMLDDTSAAVRGGAAWALAKWAPRMDENQKAQAGIVLEGMLEDENENTRHAVAWALVRIKPEAEAELSEEMRNAAQEMEKQFGEQ